MESEASRKNGRVSGEEQEFWTAYLGEEEGLDPQQTSRRRVAVLREEALRTGARGLLRQAFLEGRSGLWGWIKGIYRKSRSY